MILKYYLGVIVVDFVTVVTITTGIVVLPIVHLLCYMTMSCSNLVNAYINAKSLFYGVNRFKVQYTCGKCAGCLSKKRTDWRVRAYYEALGCLRAGGYVLFDTLTMADDHIKRYSDIFPEMEIPQLLDRPCFSRKDVKDFFKRLRVNLTRAGYDVKSTLRYILTSEYGSSELTRGFVNTHRPHYHVLFFVTAAVPPLVLSRHIAKAWYLGKTDGVRPCDDCSDCPLRKYCRGNCLYQSPQYVENERLISSSSVGNCLKCVNYVTKYISKDMVVSSELQNRVDTFWRLQFPDYQLDINLYRKYRIFCNQVLEFHLQSRGFGAYLLENRQEMDYFLKTNTVHLPSGKADVVRSVAVPRYYHRKLWYVAEKVDGRVKWSLTPQGVDRRISLLDSELERFKREYRAYDSRLSNSRLDDLALYAKIYRGVLTDEASLYQPYKEFVRRMITPRADDAPVLYVNRATHLDKLTIGKFLAKYEVVDDDGEVHWRGKQLHKEFQPYDGYVVCNDKTCVYWHGFDRKLAAYDRWRKLQACSNDALQYSKDKSIDYHKRLGMMQKMTRARYYYNDVRVCNAASVRHARLYANAKKNPYK